MLRRFLLVGLMVIVHSGEMLQLIIGTLITAILLLLTVLAEPYRQLSDNYVSHSRSPLDFRWYLQRARSNRRDSTRVG